MTLSKQIQTGLEEWAGHTAHSSRFLDFYLKLLGIQAEIEEKLSPPDFQISQSTISQRMHEGKPLVAFDDFVFDHSIANQAFQRIVTLFNAYPEIWGETQSTLKQSAAELPVKWIRNWLENTACVESEIDSPLMTTLFNQTFRPFLVAYSQTLKGRFEQERWRRNYCPICGGTPDFAYLEKDFGARYLVCSRCTGEWLYQRMECPYCLNNDHKNLAYLTSDSGVYRLYLCENCHSYLKCVDLRKSDKNYLMPLLALTTIAMDKQAQEKGFHHGP